MIAAALKVIVAEAVHLEAADVVTVVAAHDADAMVEAEVVLALAEVVAVEFSRNKSDS